MSEPNPYRPDGEPEYQWGPEQPYGYPQETRGYGYPQGAGPGFTQAAGVPVPVPYGQAVGGAPALAIGDITVVGDTIMTPAGGMPLRGAVWNASDLSRTEEKIPVYAIVLAVLFVGACGLGLLFLLIKEKETSGFVQVTVTSGGKHHATMIPAMHPHLFQQVMAQVGYARSISAM
ncbi:hypothetical protein GCM10010387_09600 [Streptomyces inusitatus]|uniref:Uncharacterized protein n=1 Tax=Streptomyces inusitatus TaxID=68221 RepID=A0A918PPZ9_9ACTN|nr:hypothetical protein [Streptomyces inusitatus]GGZ19029.1 hypothetical protein GCM10010387_09600 [Streptomyces inusitatus]